MRAGSSRVHDALGDPLMIEMRDFIPEDKIFEQRRSADSRFERVLIILDDNPLISREGRFLRSYLLMGFAAEKTTEGCHRTRSFIGGRVGSRRSRRRFAHGERARVGDLLTGFQASSGHDGD